jgi:hypothetical protein
MPHTTDGQFDAAIFDREQHPVALIEVKTQPLGNKWTPYLRRELMQRLVPPAEFLIAIDPVGIHLYRLSENELGDAVVHLDTSQILSHYDPDFTGKRIFEQYLLTLAEAWLRDLAYGWKSPSPPGSDELKAAGFLERVAGGTTQPPGE